MQVKAEYFQRKNGSLFFIKENKELLEVTLPPRKVKVNLIKGENYILDNTTGKVTIKKCVQNEQNTKQNIQNTIN